MGKVTYVGNEKAIERFLLGIFTLYTITLMLISSQNGWSRVNDVIWMVALLISWSLHLGKYKEYEFRMKTFALLTQVSVILYAVHSEDFQDAIPTFMVFVVLLGLSGIESLTFITVGSIAFIFVITYGEVIRFF